MPQGFIEVILARRDRGIVDQAVDASVGVQRHLGRLTTLCGVSDVGHHDR